MNFEFRALSSGIDGRVLCQYLGMLSRPGACFDVEILDISCR